MSYLLILIIIFLLGLYFYVTSAHNSSIEGMTQQTRCPNILVQKGKNLYLYNSKIAKVPGVNPIEFANLEDYVEFTDWQRSQGIRCPVLYLQHSYDTQGEPVYKIRPGPVDLQGGLPPAMYANPNPTLLVDATQNDPPYNTNSVPSFDQSSYYVGTTTPLDQMNADQQQTGVSPNPMDQNWGGDKYTQSLIDRGVYAGNEVNIRVA